MADLIAVRNDVLQVLNGRGMSLAETLGVLETVKFEICLQAMSSKELLDKMKRDLDQSISRTP